MNSKLVLIRHGKSEWNKLGLWTGRTDVDLVDEGIEEARRAGEILKDVDLHSAHVSTLKRAQQTFEEVKKVLNKQNLEARIHPSLNERDYGKYTGKNKWQVKEEVGEETFQRIRRGWNEPIPGGETLKDVHDRVVPYYQKNILPELKTGQNVILVAHGNTLRALVKHLENISEEVISEVEIGTGEVYCYEIDPSGSPVNKEIRATNSEKMKV